ncbi:MAG TPA: efflux RND transporter periplasmic adaptor subunit [Desulfuromonadales bacterium]|nr:efflux RND transporter periplasmic adaptor subunit [Desulfuromonadales bacterium]
MKKRIIFAVFGVLLIVAVLAGIKTLQIRSMIAGGKKFVPPPETVTTALVTAETWETSLSSVGSLTAVQGVTVAAEAAGKVMKIAFESGSPVAKGDLLMQQDISSEEAQLPGAQAQATLAETELKRAQRMLADGIIAQTDLDKALAASLQAKAAVDTLRAAMAKKTVHAPFAGRLGIRTINQGQMLREGDQIVTLQALDPVFVDFSLPQQQLSQLKMGYPVRLSGDVLGTDMLTGKITAINPLVDAETRAVKIQATVSNKGERLRPGMYITVSVGLPTRQQVLAIPATSVLYAPYSDSVFIVENAKEGKGLVVRQQFIRLGEKRGDFVAVTSGLKIGETVVSTGVFKLRNGQAAVIDNKLAPQFQHSPKPENN